jgi:hypothetical protein
MEKYKIIAIVIFSFAIFSMTIYLITHKEAFDSKYNITYPDGCQEAYINYELVSEECTAGRLMIEQAKKEQEKINNPSAEWILTEKIEQ